MNNPFDLSGKRILVTGGTRGLGHGMAEGLLEQGATVVIWGTNNSALTVANEFKSREFDCHGMIVDLADRNQRTISFAKTLELLGGIDVLVNNAGIQRSHPANTFPLKDWDQVIEVNLTAPFHLCQMASVDMLTHGGGKIINVASLSSFFGGYNAAAYVASKGGIAQLTKALSNDWADKNIQVNAIAPGHMATDMTSSTTEQRYQDISARIPSKRWGTEDDVKGLCIFLASSGSDYLTGTVIPVDGGYLAR